MGFVGVRDLPAGHVKCHVSMSAFHDGPPGKHWEVSLSSYYRDNDSNVAVYDYDRTILGTYVTYRF